ncbi:hypothetical protein GG344DRAFT_66791 [Lentinula edodes]|nr:hypothetical protein GG344DRAFT_66791 [Lentinula edodes]
MTGGLDNEFGDVHYNTSNSRYWVRSEAAWRVQTPNVAFVHPGSGRRKLTWDRNNKRWRDHYQNSGRISEHPEGIVSRTVAKSENTGEKKKRVSKRKRVSGDESGKEDNAITRLDKGKGRQIEPMQHPETAPGINQNDLWFEVHRYWSSQHCRHPVVEEVAIEILDLVKELPLVRPNESRIVKIAPSYELGEFHESYLFQDIIALAAADISVANLGKADKVSISHVLANFAGKDKLTKDDAYYSIVELEPKALSGGFRDLEFEWADHSSSGIIFDPRIPPVITFTQNGAFTLPHTDGMGSSMRIGHLSGAKLWILWPPTEKNLAINFSQWFEPGVYKGGELGWFLQRLENPELVLFDGNITVDLPPCTIHACLSLTQSSHVGQYFCRSDGFDTARLVNHLFSEKWGGLMDHWKGQQREWRRLEGEIGEGLEGEASRRQLKDAMAYHEKWNSQSVAEFKIWRDVILEKDGNSWKRIAQLEQDSTNKKEMIEWIRDLYRACRFYVGVNWCSESSAPIGFPGFIATVDRRWTNCVFGIPISEQVGCSDWKNGGQSSTAESGASESEVACEDKVSMEDTG